MRPIARLLASSLFILSLPLSAAEVAGLYEVRQPVTSQSDSERNTAMAQALQQMAVRLTGNPAAATDSRLQPLLASPQALVQQFVYESGKPLDLLVTFDPQQLPSALSAAGLTLWSTDRPQVLVWWLSETPAGIRLAADTGSENSQALALRAAAQHSGLPLALPLGDLAEQGVNAAILQADDDQELASLSERYPADVRLAVVEQATDSGVKASWRLRAGDETLSGDSEAADSATLAGLVLRDVASQLATRFTADAGSARELLLEIEGVDLAGYSSLQRLLQPFQPRLVEMNGQRQRYLVKATPAQLRSQLALGRLQEQHPDGEAADAETPVLYFHF